MKTRLINKRANLNQESPEYTPIDPLFFQKAFSRAVKKSHQESRSPIAVILCEEYDELSRRLDRSQIQEACSVRNVLRTRALAQLMFHEDGELNNAALAEAISVLKVNLYSLGPQREYDTARNRHLLNVLLMINSQKEAQAALRAISAPYENRIAEQLIRDTLQLPTNTQIKDLHARQACLSAWMCMLRQNVGSCFATAPAILVHEEQPLQMLLDLQELLSTGRLNRVYAGIEFSAPLSSSWGSGDLKRTIDPKNNALEYSPGILNGLIAAKVISAKLKLKEQIVECRRLINKSGSLTTPEDVMKAIIMEHCGVTAKSVAEAQLIEKSEAASPLFVPTPPKASGKGVVQFEKHFHAASREFILLADNPLLKSWEFTIASFSESKADFTRWNLYASLGLRPEEKGGLGECLYTILKQKVEECNYKVQEMQEEYERAYSKLKYMEARYKNASSEKEAHWLRSEYQSVKNEFYTLEEIRNDYNGKGQRFSHLFDLLINEYDDLFFKYFQEIYDADMHDITAGPYDDSPAGFRLVYKYGRTNTSQWTRINDQHEFIEALARFFSNTEVEIASHEAFQGIEQELSEIISSLITHVRTIGFLETAFDRMARAHQTRPIKNPLEHLDQIDKKPWVYTSGGTMNNLVSAYWGRESKPTSVERWVENSMELLVFFTDTIKRSPTSVIDLYRKAPQKRVLMHSPTHAFTLLPGAKLFSQAWNNESFTYTWIRDNLVRPRQEFVETMILEEDMIEAFLGYFATLFPIEVRPMITPIHKQLYGRHTPIELRKELHKLLPRIPLELIDEGLYNFLPLLPLNQFGERLNYLVQECKEIPEAVKNKMIALYEKNTIPYSLERYIPVGKLIDAVKALYILATGKTTGSLNIHEIVLLGAQRLGYTYPPPILVADSNWIRDYFAFVVNPGTGELDFWRIDDIGAKGAPIMGWRVWLDGSRREPSWGLYTHPFEYTSKYSIY